MKWYFKVVHQYGNFSGRASRKEFWMFVLFNFIFALFFSMIDVSTGFYDPQYGYGVLTILYSCLVFLPSIAVVARRLHDIGKSGWMMLIYFIPFIGPIWFFLLMITPGDSGKNQYGLDPYYSMYLKQEW